MFLCRTIRQRSFSSGRTLGAFRTLGTWHFPRRTTTTKGVWKEPEVEYECKCKCECGRSGSVARRGVGVWEECEGERSVKVSVRRVWVREGCECKKSLKSVWRWVCMSVKVSVKRVWRLEWVWGVWEESKTKRSLSVRWVWVQECECDKSVRWVWEEGERNMSARGVWVWEVPGRIWTIDLLTLNCSIV